jgi:hypothetical protein
MRRWAILTTFIPLIPVLLLAILWWIKNQDFESALAVLSLMASIVGIFADRWVSASEKRRELLVALVCEFDANARILRDSRFQQNSHDSGQPVVFPRLVVSVTETAIASSAFAERRYRELFLLLHQWRDTVNEFNRRLDITELRTFMNPSPQETRSFYRALRESSSFQDAVSLTNHIDDILSKKYLQGMSLQEIKSLQVNSTVIH